MSFVDHQACMRVFLLAAAGCGRSGQQGAVAFRDAQGRLLSPEDLQKLTGSLRYEVYDRETVSAAAKALHQQGRDAGGRGNYEEALALFTRAAGLEPRWPYPVYDRAYTHLLMKNFDAALADYRRTATWLHAVSLPRSPPLTHWFANRRASSLGAFTSRT